MRFKSTFPFVARSSLWQRSRGQILVAGGGLLATIGGYLALRRTSLRPSAAVARTALARGIVETVPNQLGKAESILFEEISNHPDAGEIRQSFRSVIENAEGLAAQVAAATSSSTRSSSSAL